MRAERLVQAIVSGRDAVVITVKFGELAGELRGNRADAASAADDQDRVRGAGNGLADVETINNASQAVMAVRGIAAAFRPRQGARK